MQTISAEEFKKRYGTQSLTKFSSTAQPKKAGYIDRVKQTAKQGIDKVKAGVNQAGVDERGVTRGPVQGFEASLKMGAGLAEAVFSPLTAAVEPVVEPTIGAGVNKLADKISDNPKVQKFATSKAGEVASRVAEDVNNLNTIAGAVIGPKVGGRVATKAGGAVNRGVGQVTSEIGQSAKNVINKAGSPLKTITGDVIPSSDRMISSQVAKALDLTPGDAKNILLSTGNDVGEFMAKNNLIGDNLVSTSKLLDDFYKQNYKNVRTEIGKITTAYKAATIPRYSDALKELYRKTAKVPGLEESANEIKSLFKKKQVTLNDVQRAKELIDKHSNLYKVTGDVLEGMEKQGLANIRKELQTFIEKEVQKNTGADIRQMNNAVQTSREILSSVKERSTRGLTRYNLTLKDLGIFGGGAALGTPLFGIALVFAKKVLESPSVKLRIAKFLDQLSDAKKTKIKTDLEAGKIPVELDQFIKKKPNQ